MKFHRETKSRQIINWANESSKLVSVETQFTLVRYVKDNIVQCMCTIRIWNWFCQLNQSKTIVRIIWIRKISIELTGLHGTGLSVGGWTKFGPKFAETCDKNNDQLTMNPKITRTYRCSIVDRHACIVRSFINVIKSDSLINSIFVKNDLENKSHFYHLTSNKDRLTLPPFVGLRLTSPVRRSSRSSK